jgi:hypothetical protein
VTRGPRLRSTGDEALGVVGQLGDGIDDSCAHVADPRDQPRVAASGRGVCH